MSSGSSNGSSSHRLGLVPCPLCKNGSKRAECPACLGAGMMPVDKAIETGLALSDTEKEMPAVSGPSEPSEPNEPKP